MAVHLLPRTLDKQGFMRRQHFYLALVFGLIGALAFARAATAQDSFLERFIRAGTPSPNFFCTSLFIP